MFKTAWFSKAARKVRIKGAELFKAVQEVLVGQADDLGSGAFKKRLNKNMHRRTLLAKSGRYWIFEYLSRRMTELISRMTAGGVPHPVKELCFATG